MLPLALLAVKKNNLPSPHWICHFLRHFVCCFYSSSPPPPNPHPTHPHCLLSAWWLVTCRPTNHSCSIPLDERFVSAGPRRRIWSAIFQCILESIPTPCYFYITVAYGSYAFDVFDMWLLLCNAASSQCCPRCYSDSEKKKISRCILAGHASGEFAVRGFWFSTTLWGAEALPSGEGERSKSPVHMEPRVCCFLLLLFYCEGWGAVLSGLLSWAAGGLLLQGALLPRAGELLKSSSSSRPLVASYCVFSRRVIRRSSSSPNSPPIRVGSPTTITSWREAETGRANLQTGKKQIYKSSWSWVHGHVMFKLCPFFAILMVVLLKRTLLILLILAFRYNEVRVILFSRIEQSNFVYLVDHRTFLFIQ